MIVSINEQIEPTVLVGLHSLLAQAGFTATEVRTQTGRYIVAVGGREIDIRTVGRTPGVRDVHYVSDPFQLASRQWRIGHSAVEVVPGVSIGRGFTIIGGPCSIEGKEQVVEMCDFLRSQEVTLMRGGAFKPRSSPYSFRGLGIEGLKMFAAEARARGVQVVTEVLDAAHIRDMYEYVDIFQVGARNAQNFTLLDGLGELDKPVLLKRGISGTVEELLQSAEYIYCKGNEKIILCERGIRTFEKAYRNTLDLNAVPYLKDKTHLPVLVDPSHGIGIRKYVSSMSLAAVMCGADGCLLEVHKTPENALSDGAQTLNFSEAAELFLQLRKVFDVRASL